MYSNLNNISDSNILDNIKKCISNFVDYDLGINTFFSINSKFNNDYSDINKYIMDNIDSYDMIIFDNHDKLCHKTNKLSDNLVIDHFIVTKKGHSKIKKHYSLNNNHKKLSLLQYIKKYYNHFNILIKKKVYIGYKIDALVISLYNAHKRKEHINKIFKNHPYFNLTFIKAHDDTNPNIDHSKFKNKIEMRTSLCRLSHIHVCDYIVNHNLDMAYVLEDDIKFNHNHEITLSDIDEIDIVNNDMLWTHEYIIRDKDNHTELDTGSHGTMGHLLNKYAASKLNDLMYIFGLDSPYIISYVDVLYITWCNEQQLKWNILDEPWILIDDQFESMIGNRTD
jgi:hypothetical protein